MTRSAMLFPGSKTPSFYPASIGQHVILLRRRPGPHSVFFCRVPTRPRGQGRTPVLLRGHKDRVSTLRPPFPKPPIPPKWLAPGCCGPRINSGGREDCGKDYPPNLPLRSGQIIWGVRGHGRALHFIWRQSDGSDGRRPGSALGNPPPDPLPANKREEEKKTGSRRLAPHDYAGHRQDTPSRPVVKSSTDQDGRPAERRRKNEIKEPVAGWHYATSAAGFVIEPHRSRLHLLRTCSAPLRCAPAGDSVCRVHGFCPLSQFYARALLKSDGGGGAVARSGGVEHVERLGSVVAGRGCSVDLLLERVGAG